MSRLGYLATRAAFALLSLWLVVTVAFALVALTGDPNQAAAEYAAAVAASEGGASAEEVRAEAEAAVETYRAARNLDEPVAARYANWLTNVATLDLGNSFTHQRPVTAVLRDRLAITLTYALPGMAIALVGGSVLGTYAVLGRRRLLSRAAAAASYTTFGVPNFWIASVVLSVGLYELGAVWLINYDLERAVLSPYNRRRLLVPALLLGTGLVAGQARYVRTAVLDRADETYVRSLRARGASEFDVARHVLKNAFAPLLSRFVSTLLGVLVLNVIVIEYVLNLPGFGAVSYAAIVERDLPLIVGVTLVVAAVGVGGAFLKDAVELHVDPRIEPDE